LHIYVVRQGDSLYSISQKFGVSADSLIYANQLQNPSALVLGQSLIIPVYTVTVTVRSGQTVYSIARSLQVSPADILSQNPSITNPDAISPGDRITVSFPGRNLGEIRTNGYAYPNISDTVLSETLPYMTYISPFSYSIDAQGNLSLLGDERIVNAAYASSTAPLMTVTNLDNVNGGFSSDIIHSVITNSGAQDNFINSLLSLLAEKGHYGVNIDFEYIYPYDKNSYNQFLRRLSQALRSRGYFIAVALAPKISADQQGTLYTSHDYAVNGEIADIVIIMTYEWGYLYGPPMAVSPLKNIRQVLDYAVTEIPRSKLFMSLPNYGYDWTLPYRQGRPARVVSSTGAVTLASNTGSEIFFDEGSASPYFNYYDGEGNRHVVWFEDARSIRAKLALIDEYGLAGVSWWTLNPLFRTTFLVLQSMYSVRKVV